MATTLGVGNFISIFNMILDDGVIALKGLL
jgi:hypothetical protein